MSFTPLTQETALPTVTVLPSPFVWLLPMDGRELTATLAAMHAAGAEQTPGLTMPPVELLITRDSHMAQWNQRFMGCDGPTNILSFPGDAESPGSLILSVDTLRREAYLYGDTELQHLLRLLAHGLGHVAGFDHGPDMDDFCDNILTSCENYK